MKKVSRFGEKPKPTVWSGIERQIKKLGLNYMVDPSENSSYRNTPFTISIDAREGITTGVSAQDRTITIRTASNINANP